MHYWYKNNTPIQRTQTYITHICSHMHMNIHMDIHICTSTHTYARMYTHIHISACTQKIHIYVHTRTHIHTHTHTHKHTHHTHTHKHTHKLYIQNTYCLIMACRQFTATRHVWSENDGGTNLNRIPEEPTSVSIYCNKNNIIKIL